MTDDHRGGRQVAPWLTACLLVAASAVGAGEAGAQGLNPTGTARVRPVDQKAAALLRAGAEGSTTFQSLVGRLEASDVIVFVETRWQAFPGQLEFVSATPGARYLRVSVRPTGIDADLVPWLAHELWHAVEIADAPDVRDPASLVAFYDRIGQVFSSGATVLLETTRARVVQEQVLTDLRLGRAALSARAAPRSRKP